MKVFISSVMKGFENYRQSARRAVELLGHQPIMAEDFGARPDGPQSACLSEVRDSDVYVIILGDRYGWNAPSGISPTEEEYDEALRTGKPILAFVAEGDKEEKQKQLATRVQDYISGVFRASFSAPENLKDAIIKSLRALEDRDNLRTRTAEEARTEFDSGLSSIKTGAYETMTLLSCIPIQHSIALSATDIGKAELQKKLAQELLLGDSAYFDLELGIGQHVDEDRVLMYQQTERQGVTAVFILSRSGQMTMGKTLPKSQGTIHDFTDSLLIDQEVVRSLLLKFASFTSTVVPSALSYRGRLYASASLVNMGMKMFGRNPKKGTGMGIYSGESQPIVSVPNLPEQIDLPLDSSAQSAVANTLIELFVRRFRNDRRLSGIA